MRHARPTSPLPIGLLALAVILLAWRRGLPAIIAAITLAAITTRTDGEKRVARWVKTAPHAKAFGRLICCHHLNRICQQMIGQMTAPSAPMMSLALGQSSENYVFR
jgi:hypothetical protein